MVEINSDIQGLKELAKNVDKLSKSFARTTLRTALRNAAKPVRQEARALVAVESGDLKGAIGVKVTVTKAGDGYADVGFDRDEFHGLFVELGTSQQRARPFLRPALEEGYRSGKIQAAFIDSLNSTIRKQLGKLKA